MFVKIVSIIFVSGIYLLASDTFYYNNSKKIYLSPLTSPTVVRTSQARVIPSINYYKTANETVVGISNKIIVKFKTLENFKEISEKFNLTLVKELYHNTYLFKLPQDVNTLDITNQIYNLQSVKYAHPNFIREAKSR